MQDRDDDLTDAAPGIVVTETEAQVACAALIRRVMSALATWSDADEARLRLMAQQHTHA